MLDSTMLDDVASTCWIRLAGPLVTSKLFSIIQYDSTQVRPNLDYANWHFKKGVDRNYHLYFSHFKDTSSSKE